MDQKQDHYSSSELDEIPYSLLSSSLLSSLLSFEEPMSLSCSGKGGTVLRTGRHFPFTSSQPWLVNGRRMLKHVQRSSWYVCTCDTAVGLNWPNPVQLHCAKVYPSPSRFPTRFPWYKLLPKQSGPDRPPAQYNWTKSSLYSCQKFKLSKSQAGCWQWEFAS